MHRREFFAAAAAFCASTAATPLLAGTSPKPRRRPVRPATPVFLNGEILQDGTLEWSNGGGDPLHASLKANHFRLALANRRLNLSKGLREAMEAKLAEPPAETINLAEHWEGKKIPGAMLSGDGKLAVQPLLRTSRWKAGRTTLADVWYLTYHGPLRIERWQNVVPRVCGNLTIIPRGGALPCICDPQWDACSAEFLGS